MRKRAAQLTLLCRRRNNSCSFDGTAVLIRAFRSPVPICKTGADGAFLELSNFEPGGPLDIARRPFQFLPLTDMAS
jgi:hypothetical protein